MPRVYKRITYEERILIKKLLNEGIMPRQIAEKIGVTRQTMYKELGRGGGTAENNFLDYDPDISQKVL